MRLNFEGWHYVTLTGIEGDRVYLFDPYYHPAPFEGEEIEIVRDQPTRYNRIVLTRYFEREDDAVYSLGPIDTREAILVFNERTRLTEDATVEYMI